MFVRRAGVLLCLVAIVAMAAHPVEAKAKDKRVEVRGGYVNHVACVPLGPPDIDGLVRQECQGHSTWDGDFTGYSVARIDATIDPLTGRMSGTYEETFVGRYVRDGSFGSLHTRGSVWVDENQAFVARAEIVGGTCSWSAARGSMAFDGHGLNGGYVGSWSGPASAPAEPCNPVGEVPM